MLTYQLVSADNPATIDWPFERFRCVVLIERPVTSEFRDTLSRDLVHNSCLYMMAWGQDCDLWDDAVDWAHLEHWDFKDSPDDKFVMTSWHNDGPLQEVLRFAKYEARTSYAGDPLDDLLILDISTAERSELIKDLYDQAQ